MPSIILPLVIGLLIGAGIVVLLLSRQAKQARELATELYRENEVQRKANVDEVVRSIKAEFGSLSLEALSKSTEELLKLAKTRLETEREATKRELDAKKGLIDQQLQAMTTQLERVSLTINELEKDRVEKFGQLDSSLKAHAEQTQSLLQTTSALRQALASTKVRGQWGERMAEDVLRLAGFVENVNYVKQKLIPTTGSKPDFTFLLPQERKLNMDVKFPLDNYLKYLEAESDNDKTRYREDFLKNVRKRVDEVVSRDYINPEQNTVDYVLLFIPNEQVYGFIHEQDYRILDDALRKKVIFCSPLTLFAVLAVIRQAADNFALEHTSREILELYNEFQKQWGKFVGQMDQLGKRIKAAADDYDEISGVRRRQLEKVLDKIELLRTETNLPLLEESQNSKTES